MKLRTPNYMEIAAAFEIVSIVIIKGRPKYYTKLIYADEESMHNDVFMLDDISKYEPYVEYNKEIL